MEETDLDELMSHCIFMAEQLLIAQNGEFYPFGAKMTSDNEILTVAMNGEDEYPLSSTVIKDLQSILDDEMEAQIISAYVIAYDSLAQKEPGVAKSNAIALLCHSGHTNRKTTCFYPYQILEDTVQFTGEPWSSDVVQ